MRFLPFFKHSKPMARDERLDRVLRAAGRVVEFCYGQDGAWIGTENIRRSTHFVLLMAELAGALRDYYR